MTTRDKSDRLHQKIYDFLVYIYPLLSKYPKYEKFSLQTATRNAILEMLQDVIKWQKTATKSHLYAADTALQQSALIVELVEMLEQWEQTAGYDARELKERAARLWVNGGETETEYG